MGASDAVPAAGTAEGAIARGGTAEGVRGQAREGLRVVVGAPRLRRAITSQAGLFVLSPVLLLSLPFIVIDELGLPQATLGYVFASALAGGILAFAVLGRRGESDRVGARYPRIGYAMTSLALAALAVSSSLPLVVAAAVVVGAAAAAVYLHAITMIQSEFDCAIHGRLFAILEAVTSLVGPISYVVTGILLDLLGPDRRPVLFAVAAAAAATWAIAMRLADRSA
ncbi:MAG: MFS transporter [Spirochaetaceae bacterium]|nr:MAG: MFS transporter [Spirochaetaceae bacterium]